MGMEPFSEEAEYAHQKHPPQCRTKEDTEDKGAGGKDASPDSGEPEPCKDSGKGKDGHWVGQGKKKRGRIHTCEFLKGLRVIVLQGRNRNHSLDAQNAQKRAANEPEEHIMADEKVRYECQAKGGYEPVNGVGCRRAHAGKEPCPPAEYEGAASAQDANGADRGRDNEADDESLEKKSRFHAKKVNLFYLAGMTLTMKFSIFEQRLHFNHVLVASVQWNSPGSRSFVSHSVHLYKYLSMKCSVGHGCT